MIGYQPTKPQLGQIVRVLRGKDMGRYAIIIGIVDQRFVMIVNGDQRKFDQPKRKSLKHLQLLDELNSEVGNSLRESGRVTNGKLRFALNPFMKSRQSNVEKKGE